MYTSERLKGIDVFVLVADLGSFTAAAERLHLTTSAISKGIARLEGRLQTRLFDRTTRRLSLTDAGTQFYRTCIGVLADLEEAELSLHTQSSELAGRVRIDLPASYGRLHVLPVILQFVQQHPLIQPHISFSDRFVDPVLEEIDIVVRIGGPDVWASALGHRYFGDQRLIFCTSPAYLSKKGMPTTDRDLEHHDCIVYGRSDGTVSPWHFAAGEAGDADRRVMPGRIALGDGEAQVAAIVAGNGIGQLPTWLIKHALEQGDLVEVLPHLATEGLAMNLVWRKSRQSLPKVSALLEALAAALTPSGSLIS